MAEKPKKRFVFFITAFIICAFILLVPAAQSVQAVSDYRAFPTFGLFCAEENVIISGSEKFVLTDSALFLKQRARKESEYRVSGNQAVTFEIPFFSSYAKIPQFHVMVNGQAVDGEVWYGANEVRYGDSGSYLEADSTDNSAIEQKLKEVYSPVLDDTVIGTLYTVTPEADNMTVSLKAEASCSYVYDTANLKSEWSNQDGTKEWRYKNALSQPRYRYFVIGENAAVDFTASCAVEKQTMPFKDFIDGNYNADKEFYEENGVPKACLYAIANRLLCKKGGMTFDAFFYDSFYGVDLNTYKFTVLLDGEATVRYSTEVELQVNSRYDPPVYTVGHKQIGKYATDYSISLNGAAPYMVQSSVQTEKSGEAFTARSTGNFYFACSASKNSVDRQAPNQPKESKTRLVLWVVLGIVCGVTLIMVFVGVVLTVRDKKKAK